MACTRQNARPVDSHPKEKICAWSPCFFLMVSVDLSFGTSHVKILQCRSQRQILLCSDDAMIQIQSSTIKPQCPHRRLGYDLVALACSQTRLHSKRASLSVRSPKLRFLNTLQYGIGKETGNHCSPPNIGGERIRWNTSKNVSKVKGNGFKLLTSIDKLVPQLEVVKKM